MRGVIWYSREGLHSRNWNRDGWWRGFAVAVSAGLDSETIQRCIVLAPIGDPTHALVWC